MHLYTNLTNERGALHIVGLLLIVIGATIFVGVMSVLNRQSHLETRIEELSEDLTTVRKRLDVLERQAIRNGVKEMRPSSVTTTLP